MVNRSDSAQNLSRLYHPCNGSSGPLPWRGGSLAASRDIMLGVAKDYRAKHGEAKFAALAKLVFEDADIDKSGSVDSEEIHVLLKRLGMRLTAEEAQAVCHIRQLPYSVV